MEIQSESLTTRWSILMTRNECLELLLKYGTPEHVKRHCLMVSEVAINVAIALNNNGFNLDVNLIEISGLLHDIARKSKNHEVVGAEIVRPYCEAAAEVIATHMSRKFPEKIESFTEADIVALADRMVKEDEYVGYEARMTEILERYEAIPEAVARTKNNIINTQILVKQIEQLVGKDMGSIATADQILISDFLRHVERPGRYIGGEMNSTEKNRLEVDMTFCFAFPDMYEIGMSYTGFQIIYGLLNAREDVLCERVFAPANDMAIELENKKLSLFSLESHRTISSFDIVGFTLQYELSYSNVIKMLNQSNIPIYSNQRGDEFPIIIAGGPCCSNVEPLADLFDIVCIGDGEPILEELCDLFIACKKNGTSKGEFLQKATQIKGIYVPSLYSPVYEYSESKDFEVFSRFEKKVESAPDIISKSIVDDLENSFYPVSPVVPNIDTVHNRAVVEVMRGCYRSCRFCQAGYACSKVRRRSPERIKEIIEAQLANTGYDEVSLLSLSTGDYPGIELLVNDLMDTLASKDVALSLPSLRLDSLKEDTLKKIGEYKSTSLTFAPEAGTQRLRDVIDKKITEDDIFRALEIALPLGFTKLKFYFMIGLPTETYEDLDGIVNLAQAVVKKAKDIAYKNETKYNFQLGVSVSNFVPKPGTPLQWEAGNSEEVLIDKIHYLKDALKRVKGTTFKYHDTRISKIEMIFAKGDRRLLSAIIDAVDNGCQFDSWREHFKYDIWMTSIENSGYPVDKDLYTDKNTPLPWDIIEKGREF